MDLRRLPNGNKASPASSSGPNRTSFSINSLLSHKQKEQSNSAWQSGNARSSADQTPPFPFPAIPLFGQRAFPQILAGMPLPDGSIHPALLFNAMAMAGAPTKYPKRHSLESIFHRRQLQPHRDRSASSDEEKDEPPKLQPSSPHSDSTGVRVELGDRQEAKMMKLSRRTKSASPNSPPPKPTHSPASSVVSSDSSSISVKNEPNETNLAAKPSKKDRSKEELTKKINTVLTVQEQHQQQWLASMNHYVHLANQMLVQQQQGLGQPFGTGQTAATGMGIPGVSANHGERRHFNPTFSNEANGAWDQRFAPPWLFGHQSAVHHSQQQLQPFVHLAQMHHPHHHHHHKGGQQKRKGGQIRFTNEQTDTLESTFDAHKYLTNSQRKKLAKSLALSERQVKTWFQNRRAKWRRIRKDGEDEEDLSIHGGFHHHHHPPVLADGNPQLPLSAVAAHSLHQAITNNVTASTAEHQQHQQHHHRPLYSASASTSTSQQTRNSTGINNHQSTTASAPSANCFRNFFSPS